jgi:hypothetical protein
MSSEFISFVSWFVKIFTDDVRDNNITKGQTMIYKALHRKLTIEHHEPGDEPRCYGRVSSS